MVGQLRGKKEGGEGFKAQKSRAGETDEGRCNTRIYRPTLPPTRQAFYPNQRPRSTNQSPLGKKPGYTKQEGGVVRDR